MTSDNKTVKLRKFFLTNPDIASQMPIGFPEQSLTWERLVVSCGTCGREIPDEYTHGTITSLIPGLITIESVSLCRNCLHLIHGIYRFRQDGSVEFVDNEGRWCKTYGRRITWWNRLIGRLKQLRPLWENLI